MKDKERHIGRARHWLATIVSNISADRPDFSAAVFLKAELDEFSVSPEDIGTTSTRLEELYSQVSRIEVRSLLRKLRSWDTDYEMTMRALQSHLEACKANLSSFGSSEEEVTLLAVQGSRLKAVKFLAEIIEYATAVNPKDLDFDFHYVLRLMRDELRKSNLKSEDLGISSVRMDELISAASKKNLCVYLDQTRKAKVEGTLDSNLYVRTKLLDAMFNTTIGKFTLEDIDSSPEEISELTGYKICLKANHYYSIE